MLKIKNVNTYYGKLHALRNVSLHVECGEIRGSHRIQWRWEDRTSIISAVTPPANGGIFDGAVPSVDFLRWP